MPIRRAVGVLGRSERAEVDERGALHASDGSWRVDWWIGDGEDRWRDPSVDPSVRHHAIDATPVFETVVRVRGGDVHQRIYAAFDGSVLAAIEVENDSTEPVAIAFTARGDARELLSPRGATSVPMPATTQGPPPDAWVFPLPHHSVLRVAVPLGDTRRDWPERLPASSQVAAGWRAIDERGERIEGPGSLPARFALARTQLLIAPTDDPAAELLAAAARWRLANDREELLSAHEVGRAGQRVADRLRRIPTALDRAALVDARVLLAAHGELRAATDVDRIVDRVEAPATDLEGDVGLIAAVRSMIVRDRGNPNAIVLLPDPPLEWAHADFTVHRVPTRWGEVSFAVRWHGERPALLWECEEPVRLSIPALDAQWTTDEPRGEALLRGASAT